ncbi:peptidylprolyl isomerase [Solimonas marina]|uniref:peptidylprolyl isomerase n=1 Tax=Solimonas marina TaxID=2714601 RepID=A0A969WAD3_9GAMM|nr:peptidylprolyl isomerase [Solimonas marina]NKF22435.1 peptidylprolyl isomerase [Solimonas marina]
MRKALAALALLTALPAIADDAAPAPALTMQQVLDATQASDWRALDPNNTLLMDLPGGRVVIELAPQFAPQHVANVKALVRAHYFDGLAITRVQDNFVTQWGDPKAGEPGARSLGKVATSVAPEFARSAKGLPFTALPDVDGYAPQTGFVDGLPAARDSADGHAWLTHCYGMVGAGRDNAPTSGPGNELYVVIGQAPRQLDRNIALVGRVVEGMPLLAALPRGDGAMGFYDAQQAMPPIVRVRIAADLPAAERPRLQLLRTDTASFTALVESRRNRRDAWYLVPAGHIDVCSVPLPVRPAPQAATAP